MYCIAIYDSGNMAMRLLSILERKGYVFEMVSTPCQLAKTGCSYSIKFPEEYKSIILEESSINAVPVREIYLVRPMFSKNKYQKIY